MGSVSDVIEKQGVLKGTRGDCHAAGATSNAEKKDNRQSEDHER
jgi:hypothetical protein